MYFKKPYLSELKRLRTGSYRSSAKGIFLDRNERLLPFDKKTSKALNKRLSKVKLNFYPDLEPFYTKLAHWLAVDRSQIFLTEGVSGAIKSLVECLTIPGKNNIVFPHPTFALYPIYCKMFDVEVKTVGYDNNYKIKFQNLLDSIDNKTDDERHSMIHKQKCGLSNHFKNAEKENALHIQTETYQISTNDERSEFEYGDLPPR